MNRIATLVAVGAATLLASTAMAQTSSTMSRSSQGTGSMNSQTSPAQNNAESRQYQDRVRGDAGFRNARTQRECGPIQSSELRQQCVDSFASYPDASPGMSTSRRAGTGTGPGPSTAMTGSSRSGKTMSGTTSSGGSSDSMRGGALRPGADASTPPKSASAPANQRSNDGGSGGR